MSSEWKKLGQLLATVRDKDQVKLARLRRKRREVEEQLKEIGLQGAVSADGAGPSPHQGYELWAEWALEQRKVHGAKLANIRAEEIEAEEQLAAAAGRVEVVKEIDKRDRSEKLARKRRQAS